MGIVNRCTEIVALANELAREPAVRRNEEVKDRIDQIRAEALMANALACQEWFLQDTLSDLDPK